MQKSIKQKKRELKKMVNYMSWGLSIYTIIFYVLPVLLSIGYALICLLKRMIFDNISEQEMDMLFDRVITDNMLGGISCISVVIGATFLFFYFCKRIDMKRMFAAHKKMSLGTFGKILCIFMGVQLVCEPIFWIMEKFFNVFGYSVATSMELACADETTFFMTLYAAIIGPIVEEVVYRGFVTESLQKYGKIFVIAISSVLFGVMHGNLPQSVFAFVAGMILGYVALEYSIWWSILLHILNNGVFGELLYFLLSGLSEQLQNGIMWAISIIFFLLGCFFVWRSRSAVQDYVIKHKPENKTILYAFTTIGMIVFIVMQTLIAFSDIEKIGM